MNANTLQNAPIRLRASLEGDTLVVKTLFTHPMENGLAKDEAGYLIPARYITQVELRLNGHTLTTLETGSGVARDPLFGWRLKGAQAGDRVSVGWRDNQGDENWAETVVRPVP
ncbi:MAG TPA: thiosulfate oxidation carrier complex protein SoxZ [Azospira sp.]|nr:thiosulfate oxidation carrier complex protein SoxZ [Azospira sp.]